jgi:hypothetical protein
MYFKKAGGEDTLSFLIYFNKRFFFQECSHTSVGDEIHSVMFRPQYYERSEIREVECNER